MSKSSFKENSSNQISIESSKRRKVDENIMSDNFPSKRIECSEDSRADNNLSVTIYEDESDISFINKSTKNRLNVTSKRSPLTTLNHQHSSSLQEFANNQIPSTSSASSAGSSKTPLKQSSEIAHRKFTHRAPTPIDLFGLLSDELLLHIFQYLPKKALKRVAQVNSRFARVVLDESLWIRLDLANRVTSRGAFSRLLPRGFVILRLAQARIQAPIFETNSREDFVSKLQYLDLSLASIDVESLAQLLGTCRLLKKLSLEQVPLNLAVCKEIAENRKLEVLNVSMCEGITVDCVSVMIASLQSLTALNISWTLLSCESVEIIVSLVATSLMRLNISGCRRSFTDKALEMLVNRCPNIVELDVSDCTMLTSVAVETVAKLNKLEYLSLSRCYNIPMTSYLSLNAIKSLMFLDVFGLLSEAGIQMLEKTFKNIGINKFIHSSVARPTVAPRRTSIWGLPTRMRD